MDRNPIENMAFFKNNTVRKAGLFFSAVFIAVSSPVAQDSSAGPEASRYEILLTGRMFDRIDPAGKLISSLEITPNRLLLLSTSDQFYLLGWGGIVRYGKKAVGSISSFAYTPDTLLMAVRNDELCVFDSLGNLSGLVKLPSRGMGICAGAKAMYVFDRENGRKRSAVYVLVKGGKYARIFESPAPISAVMEMNGLLLLAIGNGLYRFDPVSKKMTALAAVQKEKVILSIALDAGRQRIYFSTDSSVCALKGSSVVVITDQFGGVIRYFADGLVVFDPVGKKMVRMAGIENAMASVPDITGPGRPQLMVQSTTIDISRFSGNWEQLNASGWLSSKAVSSAGRGDLAEADFLLSQALLAANGGRLAVKVPSAPQRPVSYNSAENVTMYRQFATLLYQQAKVVAEAARQFREAQKDEDAAAKKVWMFKYRPSADSSAPDLLAARQELDEADRKLADARQQFDRQKEIGEELGRMCEEVNRNPAYFSRFQPKQ
jgi:hypothetical protein